MKKARFNPEALTMEAAEQGLIDGVNRREELLLRARSLSQRVEDRVADLLESESNAGQATQAGEPGAGSPTVEG
jgi:hypothetical protein